MLRGTLAADVLKVPPDRLRVVTPHVGGGFGTKLFTYREYALAAVAARQLKRPVRWIAERTEHFLGDAQGRDNITTAKLALDERGRFLALDIDIVADMGAYLSAYAPYIPYLGAGMSPGVYDIPACFVRLRAAYTNTVPVDAYRGAGRPEAAYVIERLVDAAARELGVAPDALRRRNFIKPKAMPYATATGRVYDTGDFAAHMARAQELADWDGFQDARRGGEAQRAAARHRACDLHRGLRHDGPGHRDGDARDGRRHHRADGLAVERAGARHGLRADRRRPSRHAARARARGPGRHRRGSRPAPAPAARVRSRAAAHRSPAPRESLREQSSGSPPMRWRRASTIWRLLDGCVRVVGTDRAVSLAELAKRPEATPDKLTAVGRLRAAGADLSQRHASSPKSRSIPTTGATRIVNYVVVDDFGVSLNPLLLAGQVHGGAVQGIGQALMEQTVYDPDSGQLITASLMDYALPRADDVPPSSSRPATCRAATIRWG